MPILQRVNGLMLYRRIADKTSAAATSGHIQGSSAYMKCDTEAEMTP